MEDSFSVRVNKTFNSLSSSSTSQTQTQTQTLTLTPSLWCLTDDEIERRSWPRESHLSSESHLPLAKNSDTDDDDDVDCPFPSSVDRLMSSINGKFKPDGDVANPNPNLNPDTDTTVNGRVSSEESDDGDDEDKDKEKEKDSGGVNEEDEVLDVGNSIGLDPTLDFEEEEDEYDKVAVGREKSGDRLYMSDVNDYLPDFYSNGEVPTSFKEVPRDPRANHLAATLRLKEDAEAAKSFNSLQVSEPNETRVSHHAQHNTPENLSNLKSILKRKEDQLDSKCEQPNEDRVGSNSEKRVRFEPSCKNSDEEETGVDTNVAHEHSSSGEMMLHKGASSQNRDSSSVPDYIRNPGRYTHYTFDSSTDMNDASNRQAYADFLNSIKKSKQSDSEDVPADLSKPVIFNPKKKASQDPMESTSNESDVTKKMVMKERLSRKTLPVSFGSESMQEEEACEMEVDNKPTRVTKGGTGQITGRRYRAKPGLESDESDT